MTDVRVGPESGLPLTRGMRDRVITYKGRETTVQMPGWYRDGSDESVHSKDDLRVSDLALVTLKAEAQHVMTPAQVREARQALGLSQAEAGRIIGGGPRAFQKYESGETMTSRAMTNVLQLLVDHPEHLESIRARVALAEEGLTRGRGDDREQHGCAHL